MADLTRRASTATWESMKAMLSLAGIREIKQSQLTVTASSSDFYLVAEETTRRVIVVHLAAGNGDIRFKYQRQGAGATAVSTNLPVIPARYLVIDAEKNDKLSFFNTSGVSVQIFFVEIE